MRYRPSPFKAGSGDDGFTLIELLAVVGVLALLMVFSIPAMRRVNEGQRMGRAVSELTGLLELARTEAIARSTYVWVGFTNRTNSSGNGELAVAAFVSRDGTPTAKASDNLIQPLAKLLHCEGVQLTGRDQLSDAVKNLCPSETTAGVFSSTAPKSLPSLQGISFDRTLTITPQGETMLDAEPGFATGFENIIDISLLPMRGTIVDPSSTDHASIWFYGASGRIQVYRLQ